MNDDTLRTLHEQLVARRDPADRARCPEPDDLLAIAERRLAEARRLVVLEHVVGCAACRNELDLLRTVVDAGGDLTPAHRAPWLALAAAIVLMVGAGTLWRLANREEPVVRGADAGAVLIAPGAGDALDAPPVLTWHRIDGARDYRVEVLGAGGALIVALETADTTVSLAGRTDLPPGAEYSWWVRARLTQGGERRSEIGRFRMR